MAYQHYLRTKYIPFSPAPIAQTNTSTYQVPQPAITGQVVGHVYQNVSIGGGMMTQKIPVTSQSQVFVSPVPIIRAAHTPQASGGFVSPVPIIRAAHTPQASGGFVSPVNLIGGHAAPAKVYQAPQQAHWSSAGTIVIDEKYNRRDGKSCQAIFLGLNSKTGMFELFYGKRNPSDRNESYTAMRETHEETSGMFDFSSGVYNDKYRVSSASGKHHAYVVRVSAPKGGIQSSVFAKNQKTLKSNRAPYEWTELSLITRIDISDAINSGILSHSKGDFVMPDVYGNYVKIFSRDAEFISAALRASMNTRGHVHQLSFIGSWDDTRAGGSQMFLNGISRYKT